MAQIVLKAKHDVTCAARRALVSGYPFAEALVEGKLAKAQVLLENGVSPLVSIDNMPDLTLNLVDYVGNGEGRHMVAARASFLSFSFPPFPPPFGGGGGGTAYQLQNIASVFVRCCVPCNRRPKS